MKIGDTRPVRGVSAVSRGADKRPTKGGGETVAPRPIADSATVMGIPEAEFTPKVRAAIMTLMEEVALMRRELETTQRRLSDVERLADQDALLPIANRRAFVREMSRVASYSMRYHAPASLVYFDINGFKAINDTYGHAAGDAALQSVAELLVRQVRESDIVGRLGGDEFGVILVHADEAIANTKAQSLAEAIRSNPLDWEGERLNLDVAYGVYALKPGVDIGEALAKADKAMYAHKNTSKTPGETPEKTPGKVADR